MNFGGRPFLSLRLACIFLLPAPVFSQSTASDSAIRAAGLNNAIAQFRDFMGTSAPFYSGPHYTEYYAQMKEGHPFFRGTMAHQGEVMFDNILYPGLSLKYDMLMNKIILLDEARLLNTTLNTEKIDYFIIDGCRFVKLYKTKTNGLPYDGFYQVMVEGKHVTVFKKDVRKIGEDSEHKRFIWGDVYYYLKKGDVYYPVRTQPKALNAMADKRAQVRSYIKSNNLSFRDFPDLAVQNSVLYYDSLLK
jgi:hypothetical protein